jgi:hypothetical protein
MDGRCMDGRRNGRLRLAIVGVGCLGGCIRHWIDLHAPPEDDCHSRSRTK